MLRMRNCALPPRAIADGLAVIPENTPMVNAGDTLQVQMLNELTYGEHTPQALLESYAHWREQKPIARRLNTPTR